MPTPLCVRRLFALTAAAVLVGVPASSRAATLEQELLKKAPELIRYLQDKQCKNVGVLKFLVQQGDSPGSAPASTLGYDLAARLEVALVLASDSKADNPVSIIRDASSVAATIREADHRTPAGRRAFLRKEYPLAWGNQSVTPDAFLTGRVSFSSDLREMTVAVQSFLARTPGILSDLFQFTVTTRANQLAEVGKSYLLRSLVNEAPPEEAKAFESISPKTHPLEDANAPVKLEVRYDGKPVAWSFANGAASLPEPLEGQAITFILRHRDPAPAPGTKPAPPRYSVVLKLNGENVLFRERLNPLYCTKWVLDPGKNIVIDGYVGEQGGKKFRVAGLEESRQRELDYGPEVGVISLVVFAEKRNPEGSDEDTPELVAMQRGQFPRERPQTLEGLQRRLVPPVKKGLIVEGPDKTPVPVVKVTFESEPVPVMSAAVTYYRR